MVFFSQISEYIFGCHAWACSVKRWNTLTKTFLENAPFSCPLSRPFVRLLELGDLARLWISGTILTPCVRGLIHIIRRRLRLQGAHKEPFIAKMLYPYYLGSNSLRIFVNEGGFTMCSCKRSLRNENRLISPCFLPYSLFEIKTRRLAILFIPTKKAKKFFEDKKLPLFQDFEENYLGQ